MSVNEIFRPNTGRSLKILFFFFCGLIYCNDYLQSQDTSQVILSMNDAVALALKNSYLIKNADLVIKQAELQKQSAINIGPTEINYKNGQLYGIENSKYLELNQNFGSIPTHIQSVKKAQLQTQCYTLSRTLLEKQVIAEAKSAYEYWLYTFQIAIINNEENELYRQLTEIAELKYKTGEISLLKKTLLVSKASEINSQYLVSTDELAIAENKLKQIIVAEGNFYPAKTEPEMYIIDRSAQIAGYEGSIFIDYYNSRYLLTEKETDIKKSMYFPEIKAGAFNQKIDDSNNLYGWHIGIAFPLWIPKQNADIKQARINSEIALNEYEQQKQKIYHETENLLFELNKYFHQIRYYDEIALEEADILLNTALLQLHNEEIEYPEYLECVSRAYQIKRSYSLAILNYNQTAIQLEIYAE